MKRGSVEVELFGLRGPASEVEPPALSETKARAASLLPICDVY